MPDDLGSLDARIRLKLENLKRKKKGLEPMAYPLPAKIRKILFFPK